MNQDKKLTHILQQRSGLLKENKTIYIGLFCAVCPIYILALAYLYRCWRYLLVLVLPVFPSYLIALIAVPINLVEGFTYIFYSLIIGFSAFCFSKVLGDEALEILRRRKVVTDSLTSDAKMGKSDVEIFDKARIMDLQIIQMQKQLSQEEKNIFNYKFERQRKSVSTYAILAVFLGGIGAHKFYLEHIGLGILYAVFFWTFIPAIIALIEILFARESVKNKNLKIAQDIFEEIRLLRNI
tara:strand:- start:127 stop:843 length:717 start_codon:yes stop_codon:yes gene_type:complete